MVEDFSLHLTTMVSQLRVLGDDITNKDVIQKLLHIVPDKLEQVGISMEMLLDLDALSIKEAVGHLCTVEQRKKPSSSKDSDGRLLLIEEWMALFRMCNGSSSSSGNHATNSSSGGGKSGSKGKSGGKQNAGGDRKSAVGCEDVCVSTARATGCSCEWCMISRVSTSSSSKSINPCACHHGAPRWRGCGMVTSVISISALSCVYHPMAWHEACLHLIRWIKCVTAAMPGCNSEPLSQGRHDGKQSMLWTLSMATCGGLSHQQLLAVKATFSSSSMI
jgi:hypothetical protein